jgi:CHAT domain-containing protein
VREFRSYTQTARQLYDRLLAPAAEVLAQKRRLVITPDGGLYYLPFECLVSKEPDRSDRADYRMLSYVLHQWEISYAPSASVLAHLGQRRSQDQDRAGAASETAFLAFADPVYEFKTQGASPQTPDLLRSLFEGDGRWVLPRLTDSRREVSEIARRYQPHELAVYLGPQAKEENVKDNEHLSRARRLHFATHGVMSERLPQYSGLVLTLDENPQEDGLLQVYEIFNLKLNAELVVLSACKTGLGKEVRGEGMIGLTRAFLYAGAPSLVVSLWSVADRSTASLMVKFYEQMDRAAGKAEGLRRAKLALMQTHRYAHPYYWAPFILVGEPK